MSTPHKTVRLADAIYEDLALRDSAVRLFESIEDSPETDFEIDFSGVRSMSRSFADEYATRRSRSTKTIREVNVPESVQRMLEAVSNGPKGKKRFEVHSVDMTIV
jgi:hypothetical protein